ncbi:DUF2934 domain-containing protein [Mesorhizobium sp.]|uniref:DUF2934 domain-containing protein n=1 Tax=Mesorhizobium sp. TaxID=1871066 RepID=UPI00338D3D97
MWEHEGSRHGDHERHWHQAKAEIDREAALPLPQTMLFRKLARSPARTLRPLRPWQCERA